MALAGDAAHPMTPNLGQGACCALEDAVVLARCIAEEASRADTLPQVPESEALSGETRALRTGERGRAQRSREVVRSSLPSALGRFERERVVRAARLTLQSRVVGALLQVPVPAVCRARDQLVLPHLFSPFHFLDHAMYDCGSLPLGAMSDTRG